MWKAYFGHGARVIGIDIDPICKAHDEVGIEIFTGSQDDPALINQIIDRYDAFDIIIDDGSHIMRHVYDSVVVFEKRPQGTRQTSITTGMGYAEQE